MYRTGMLRTIPRCVLAAAVGLLVWLWWSASIAMAGTVVVQPGQSIQAAIDAAAPGTTILVRPGTYQENLEIITDGLTLRGAGMGRTILVMPDQPLERFCTPVPNDPDVAGICATGGTDWATGLPIRFLNGVTISGFSVRGFTGTGIAVVGVADGVVALNEVADSGAPGIFTFNSTRSKILGNDVHGNARAGIQVDRFPETLPPARALVSGNNVHDNPGDGILVLDAEQGTIAENASKRNCAGVVLVNLSGSGARNWHVSANIASANTVDCPSFGGLLTGIGVGVIGGSDVVVEHNVIVGNRPGPSAFLPSGGVVVLSSTGFGGSDPSGVRVSGNVLRGNEDTDLFWDGTGADIQFSHNACNSSDPAGLCGP
jgi:nitrous oxidase accessory protein NosD